MFINIKIYRFFRRRQAVSGVEYALVAALIAVTVIGSVTVLGGNTGDVLGLIRDQITGASGSSGSGSETNTAPSISNLSNAQVEQDTAYGPVDFFIGDIETLPGSLSVSGSSSNATLVPNGNISFGGSGGSRTISITPAAGQSGQTTITVTVDDGTDTASDNFVLTVSPSCSGGLSAGDPCFIDGEEVVFVANYNPGDGGGSRPLYAQHCDLGMSWDGTGCTGTRGGFSWSNGLGGGPIDTAVPNNTYDDGDQFTDILVTADSSSTISGTQPHNAAQACRDLGSEWFLPARAEVGELYTARSAGDFSGTYFTAGGGVAMQFYWSSSESDDDNAHYVNYSNGSNQSGRKIHAFSVRCTRR